MKKLGIIVDSFAATDKKTLDKDGYYYLPHTITIDGKDFKDNINITINDVIKAFKKTENLKSSQPSTSEINSTFKKSSKENDDVLYLPMASGISGTCSAAKIIARKYDNVKVVDNWLSGKEQYSAIINHAQKMYKSGSTIQEIIKWIKEINAKILTFVIPQDLDALFRGGRIGKKTNFVLKKIKIIPILHFKSEVKVKTIKRTQSKAIIKAIELLNEYIKKSKDKFNIYSCFAGEEMLLFTKEHVKRILKQDLNASPASSVIVIHTGPGALSISAFPKF